MIIGEIPYTTQFYWKGVRYKQVIRPKGLYGKGFTVVCVEAKSPLKPWVDMPSGRTVKPVVRCPDEA